MSETVKINLNKTLTSLKIMSIVAGALIAGAYVYGGIDDRMDKIEQRHATFKGIIEERTRNTSDNVKELKTDMKLLLNKLELDHGKNQGTQIQVGQGAEKRQS